VTWELACTLVVVMESTFACCSSHLYVKLYFPSATAKLDPWRVPVQTPHLFQWPVAATAVLSCVRSEGCCLLPVRRTTKSILEHDGSGPRRPVGLLHPVGSHGFPLLPRDPRQRSRAFIAVDIPSHHRRRGDGKRQFMQGVPRERHRAIFKGSKVRPPPPPPPLQICSCMTSFFLLQCRSLGYHCLFHLCSSSILPLSCYYPAPRTHPFSLYESFAVLELCKVFEICIP
jgi:hypothetical protein